MGKNKIRANEQRRNGAPSPAAVSGARPPAPTAAPARPDLAAVHARALEAGNGLPTPPRPAPPDLTPEAQWKLVDEAEQLFLGAAKRHNDAVHALEEQQKAMASRAAELDERERVAKDQTATAVQRDRALGEQAARLAALERGLNAREELVRGLEAEAEAGFSRRHAELTSGLGEQVRLLGEQHAALQRRLAESAADQVQASEEVWSAAREAAERVIDAERAALVEEREQLAAERASLQRGQQELRWERADVVEERSLLSARADALAAHQIAARDGEIAVLRTQLEEITRQRDAHHVELVQHEARSRRFGHRTEAEVERLLEEQRLEIVRLEAEIAVRPARDLVAEAEALRAQRDTLHVDLGRVRHEAEVLRISLMRAETGVAELEALRDQRDSYRKSNELLQASNEQLRRDIDQRVRSQDGSSPFPACAAMDVDPLLSGRRPVSSDVRLGELVERICRSAASASKPLRYAEEDVRAFIGGMAFGRLALLQGPSGTGKTSLPFAVADALGAHAALVPAEAGWHDPADLIGHYNQFDRRFDERPFLQALYRAGTGHYQDVPVFVVIDEMNLSHPEQYFSQVLSMLEAPERERWFDLLPMKVTTGPQQLRDGRSLQLPGNVWFVGTANHDETTKDFADKTYDRAQVIELPLRPPDSVAKVSRIGQEEPVGVEALGTAFRSAMRRHEKEAERALRLLEDHLREPLHRHLGVSWTNRLPAQARAYIPVVIEAGGSVGEALDHLIAMRLLRKIRGRHANRVQDLQVISGLLGGKAWEGLSPKRGAVRSLALLKGESDRISREQE